MKRLTAVCLLCILLFALCTVVGADTPSSGRVLDEAGVLTDAERADISRRLSLAEETIRERTGESEAPRLFVCVTDRYTAADSSIYSIVDAYRLKEKASDFSLLVIYTGSSVYYYDVYVYGYLDRKISDSKLDRIYDAIEYDVKHGNFAEAATGFGDAVAAQFSTRGERVGTAVLVGALIGAVVALIVFFSVRAHYRKKSRSSSYPLEQFTRLYLNQQTDEFVTKTVTKVYVGSSSSSGGRSGGGGGGGGRSGGVR